MDTQTVNQRLQELSNQAQSARIVIHGEVQHLRHQLNLPLRIRSSIQSNPKPWLFGSIGAGILTTLGLKKLFKTPSFSPSPVENKPKGLTSIVLGFAFAAARPFLKSWLSNQLIQLSSTFQNRASHPQPTHPSHPQNSF